MKAAIWAGLVLCVVSLSANAKTDREMACTQVAPFIVSDAKTYRDEEGLSKKEYVQMSQKIILKFHSGPENKAERTTALKATALSADIIYNFYALDLPAVIKERFVDDCITQGWTFPSRK